MVANKGMSFRALLRDDLNFYVGPGWLFWQLLKAPWVLRWQFMFNVRLQGYFAHRRWLVVGPAVRWFCKARLLKMFSSDIHCNSQWGRRVRVAHPLGIVVGSGVQIGDGCTIYQNVTLGARKAGDGQYPELRENVTVFANACCVGGIVIGANSIIGANTLVRTSCPADSVVSAPWPRVKSAEGEVKP